MKRIYIFAFLLMLSVVMFAATVAHPVIVEVQEEDGSILDEVFIQAWLLDSPLEILTQETDDVYYHADGYIHIQCGQFAEWNLDDVLHIELMALNGAEAIAEYALNYDNYQYYGLPEDGMIMTGGVDDLVLDNLFNAGWNLWSYNVQLTDHNVETVLNDGLEYLTKVKSITQSYDPDLGTGFNTLTELVDGYGYWVQVSQEDSLSLSGEAIPLSTTIALDAGWNLVAYLPQDAQAPADAFADLIADSYLEKVKSITQSYDPGLGSGFNTLASMMAGNGYWVNVNTAIVDFMYPFPAGRTAEVDTAKEYIWTPVIYTNSTCAYGYTSAADGYVGAFVNGECRAIADVIDGSLSFVINGEIEETVSFKLFQDGAVYDGDISITTAPGEDVSDFVVDFRSEAPAVTGLSSIYPNPFNPVTTVAFDLAQDGKVDLAVYNIKGQKVSELVNGTIPAGEHQIVWNAAGKASGVYFIRLSTDDIQQTRKVILMK